MYVRIFLVFLFSSYALGNVRCGGYYMETDSIQFGKLFSEATDMETLHALNQRSKANLLNNALNEEQQQIVNINHMINTLLYYRALQRLRRNLEVPDEFKDSEVEVFYLVLEEEAKGKNEKFNYFKEYIKEGLIHQH